MNLLLVIYSFWRTCFWWTCFWWCHHFRSAKSSGALLTSGAVLLRTLLSFFFVQFFVLFCSFRTYKWSQKLCLWSCTLEQILAYPINNVFNTLLSFKTFKGNVKHILFQHTYIHIVFVSFVIIFNLFLSICYMCCI